MLATQSSLFACTWSVNSMMPGIRTTTMNTTNSTTQA